MKTLISIMTCLLIGYAGFAQGNDAETLKQLNIKWITSYVTRDTTAMSSIFAEDLVLTNPGGKIFHKQDILKAVMSPTQEYLSSKVDTASVRFFGKVGIINAQATLAVKTNGETHTVSTNYMDVYEKRNGRWYAVAAHVTMLNAK